MQVRLSKFVVDPYTAADVAVFQYMQRVLEIIFVGIAISCILTTVLPTSETRSAAVHRVQMEGSNLLMGKQLNSVVVNIQRTFADTVASIIPDVQTRRMVVLLGLCMLPSIASVVSDGIGSSSSSSISIHSVESFFLVQRPRSKQAAAGSSSWHPYARMLFKICITGLSMAWINTALGFIIPSKQPAGALGATISLVSTVSLAILMRSLHPMFPGLCMTPVICKCWEDLAFSL